MTRVAYLSLQGRRYVLLPRKDYEELVQLARLAGRPPRAQRPVAPVDVGALGHELRRRRTIARLSQAELASLAGVRLETVSRIERGRNVPNTITITKLDAALAKANRRNRRTRS